MFYQDCKNIIHLLLLVILPLLVIGALSYLGAFDIQLQQQFMDIAVKCSGHIAAYIILFCIFYRAYKWFFCRETPEDIHIRERIKANINKISGNWKIRSFYNEEGGEEHTVQSECQISLENNHAKIIGTWADNEGNQRGWKAHSEHLDEQELTFIFDVPTTIGQTVLGICQVAYGPIGSDDGKVHKMTGSWGILARNILGKLVMERAD